MAALFSFKDLTERVGDALLLHIAGLGVKGAPLFTVPKLSNMSCRAPWRHPMLQGFGQDRSKQYPYHELSQ